MLEFSLAYLLSYTHLSCLLSCLCLCLVALFCTVVSAFVTLFVTSLSSPLLIAPLQKSGLSGSREGTPSRHSEGDTLSIDSGDLLGNTPPGSPARRRKYPNLAVSPTQREGSGSNVQGGLMKTHLGEASDGGFFSEKINRTITEKCYINGL